MDFLSFLVKKSQAKEIKQKDNQKILFLYKKQKRKIEQNDGRHRPIKGCFFGSSDKKRAEGVKR